MFMEGVTAESLSGTIPEYLFFAFQMTFFIITPLIVGAFVERMKMSAMLVLSLCGHYWCIHPSVTGFGEATVYA